MDEVGKEGQNQVPGSLSAEQHAGRLVGSTPANNQQRWMFRLTTREWSRRVGDYVACVRI